MIEKIVYNLHKHRIIRIFSARFVLFNFFGKQIKWPSKTLKKDSIHNKTNTQSPSADKSKSEIFFKK